MGRNHSDRPEHARLNGLSFRRAGPASSDATIKPCGNLAPTSRTDRIPDPYPIIERIWLRRYLGNEVIETHAEIQSQPPEEIERRESA